MRYSVYHPNNGQIVKLIIVPESDLDEDFCIPDHYDPNQYYVSNGVAVELPPRPNNSLCQYDFDFDSHSWILNDLISGIQVRAERTRLLGDVDRVTPVWYASLNQEQQAELNTYRLALLDVPQQTGFPTQVNWPAKPTWI